MQTTTSQSTPPQAPSPPAAPAQSAKPAPASGTKLDIQAEFAKLRTMYAEDTNTKKINILLLGESGTGKTYLANSAPSTPERPVHIDSFDPGGAKGLRSKVASGHIVVSSWEKEDPWNPTQFKAWEKETDRRIKLGYFDSISTYMLDSATTWSAAVMHEVLKLGGIPGQTPRRNKDYMPQKTAVLNWITRLLSLPCNVIITGHLKTYEKVNEAGNVVKSEKRFMTVGDTHITIPLKFDEIWVMKKKDSSKGPVHQILTSSTETDLARSRLSAGGLLDQYESADLTAILRKAKFI